MEALEDAEAAVGLRPDWVKGHLRKSEALFGLKRYADCCAVLTFALEMEPENLLFRRRLSRSQSCIDDLNQGVEIHQLCLGRELGINLLKIGKKGWFSPIQNLIFDYGMQLKNFIYVIVNTYSSECVVVDACWDIDGIIDYVNKNKLKLVGAIVTHYHIDHIGGIPPDPFDRYKIRVDGVAKLYSKLKIPIYAHEDEIEAIIKGNPEMKRDAFKGMKDKDILVLPTSSQETTADSKLTILEFMHTPGHTPGSQCIVVNGNRLFSGDVLFIRSHGRTDFPDSDQELMNNSLQKLRNLDENILVYAGHDYGGDCTTISIEKQCGVLGNF